MAMTEQEIRNIFSHLDQSKWTMKTIDDIIEEVLVGETQLVQINNIYHRKVVVGFCEITNRGKRLMEQSQTWHNGQVRYRNQPVAGKLRFTMNPQAEMLREIEEELGIPSSKIKLVFSHMTENQGDSPYFPGVPGLWEEHHFIWCMPDEMVQENYTEDDGRKVTVFGWEDIAI